MRDLLSDLNNYAWPAKLEIYVRYGEWWCQRFLLHQLALESYIILHSFANFVVKSDE